MRLNSIEWEIKRTLSLSNYYKVLFIEIIPDQWSQVQYRNGNQYEGYEPRSHPDEKENPVESYIDGN